MRTKLAVLALLVTFCIAQDFSDPSFVGSLGGSSGGGGGGEGGCATTDTAISHDEMLEGWQGASQENTWTAAGGSDYVTLDLDYDSSALSSGKPAGACDEAFRCTITTAGTPAADYVYWDNGSVIATNVTTDFVFYLYLLEELGTTSVGIVSGGIATNPGSNRQWFVNLIRSSTLNKITGSGTTTSSITGTNSTLAVDTWYKITVHNEETDTNSYIQVNDWDTIPFQRQNAGVQYIHAGAVVNVGGTDEADFVIDVLAWNKP